MAYTDDEIRNYIKNNLLELNLTEKEEERYLKFIKGLDIQLESKRYQKATDTFSHFEQKLEELYARFIHEGYTEEQSIILTKKTILFTNRREVKSILDFVRVANFEERAFKEDVIYFFRRINFAHAKKMFLLNENKGNNQTSYYILRASDKNFEKKFSTNIAQLQKKYPITEEIKQILAYLANFTDKDLKKELGVTREQLSFLYPTTLDEVSTLKMLAKLSDEEIKERYGITRDELLQKYPLNNDTLKALRSINQSSETAINKVMNQTKDEVLHLRTITTDMIKQANQKIKLQRQQQKVKCMKKGAIN